MPNPEDYTIGWVCAIGTEGVAARVFLDEEHDDPESLPVNDDNAYTLGRIGKHNVVIATLPKGEYGLGSANTGARDMIRSFPNLRVGLMVGIGGGAPARHDIRLGDVVVSTPVNGTGGVYQYDYGKTIQNNAFVTTGFLNKPPNLMMTAVARLEATYAIKGHELQGAIESVLHKYPRLLKDYPRPPADTDRLFKADVLHASSNDEHCLLCPKGDISKLVPRQSRPAEEDDPVIHHGLIASANQLMKDALMRDKLSAEKDVLCFEMEAAGLMNQFPFLVIRGICDYSDTHKNKQWQGYAAMTAAAYAKDLLRNIAPNQIRVEPRLGEALSDVLSAVTSIKKEVLHTNFRLDKQEDQMILDWLTPLDYGQQQTDHLKRRQPGTGQWLLESDKYQSWASEPNGVLFCPGIPGAGKTILTSIIVNDLETRFRSDITTTVAYIYCNYKRKDEQNVENLLSSLLKQLAQGQPTLPDCVKDLYTQRTRPSLYQISEALELVIRQYDRVFILIDALDECQVSDGCRIKLLSTIFDLQRNTNANVFATSRRIPEIMDEFKESPSLEIRANESDIRRYLEGHLTELPKSIANQSDIRDEIIASITRTVDGMFLLAQLHFDSLKGKYTKRAVRQALAKLATGSNAYDAAYESAMERIQGQLEDQADLAKQVLSWITCAKRPLEKLELLHALAVEVGQSELDKDNIPEIEDMLSICAGLVTHDKESDVVRLVHFTTQEYFVRTQSRWFPDAQLSITTICVTYLSFKEFEDEKEYEDKELFTNMLQRIMEHPFYRYASRYWGHHAHGLSTVKEVIHFLQKPSLVAASAQCLDEYKSYFFWRDDHHGGSPLPRIHGTHMAAFFGLDGTIATLFEDCPPDIKDYCLRTPLSWAAARGHETLVRLLLQNPLVNADVVDDSGYTPLALAAMDGHDAVVQLLLNTDKVDVNAKNEYGETPLFLAAKNGHEAVVRLLLGTGKVDANSKDEYGRTLLSIATVYGREAVVQILLDSRKVDVDSKDRGGRSAFLWAALQGHKAVLQLLLRSSVIDINSRDWLGFTALAHAAKSGFKDAVQLLLDTKDIDPDAIDLHGRTPLSGAAESGHEAMVRLLLDDGRANPDAWDLMGWTPLSLAAARGHESVVKLLLDTGKVDPDSKDKNGQTPLLYAAEKGYEAVVRLLLGTGKVDPNPIDNDGLTALSSAATFGHEPIVRLLLDTGKVDPDLIDHSGRTALSRAATSGHDPVVRLLLNTGKVDVESRDKDYSRTPLLWAARNGHEPVVQLLLDIGRADPAAKDVEGQTSLALAEEDGHEAVVQLLLDRGKTPRALGQEANGADIEAPEVMDSDGLDNIRSSPRGLGPLTSEDRTNNDSAHESCLDGTSDRKRRASPTDLGGGMVHKYRRER